MEDLKEEGGIQKPKDPIMKDRVFESLPGFKEWIEQTSLFSTIKRFAGSGLIIQGLPDSLRLQLNGISNVQAAEDLPIELIQQFYSNSPWHEYETTVSKIHKLIENARDEEI